MRRKQQDAPELRDAPRDGFILGFTKRALSSVNLRRRALVVRAIADGAAWMFAVTLASLVRYDFAVDNIDGDGLAVAVGVCVVAQALIGWLAGLYSRQYRLGSFDEVAALTATTCLVTATVFLIDLANQPRIVPLSATVGGGFIALVVMCGVRYAWRAANERVQRPRASKPRRLIVFGAGEGGAQVIAALLRNPDSPWLPVALVDDNRYKAKLSISGVRVMGDRTRIADIARVTEADTIVIAVASASAELIREVSTIAREAGLEVRVMPSVTEIIEGSRPVSAIRKPTMADLLGRHPVTLDVASIAGAITGRRVLVTGAGGSIGSELCRQLHRFGAERIVLLDRDESALHATQLSIEGRALLDSSSVVLADICDEARLRAIFEEHRPHVVFHAAALKHLTLLERHPALAVAVNVLGTRNVLRAAATSGVERLVNVSTDKAADPTSVLGYTKRLAERMTASFRCDEATFLSVRFGNVLGSRGSVLTTFEAQIAAGGPITVTDPEVTRYFMTVEEACQLTVQAAAVGHQGEVLVLDMGSPVRIADVARQLADASDPSIRIVYTGLRPGEKLHESLFGGGELDHRPFHPQISHTHVPPLDPAAVDALPIDAEPDELTRAMAELAREPMAGSPHSP